jgi:Fe-S cluster assembly iron-binding protein IscA
MINITERAKQKLQDLRSQALSESNPETANVGLRLDQASPGQLGLFPDAPRDGDEVVEYDGAPVLLVGEAVARAITGTTIDCEDDGSRLVIKRGGTAA